MKKIALLFVAIATVISLVACGEENESSNAVISGSDTSVSTRESSAVSETASSESAVSETASSEGAVSETASSEDAGNEITFTEMTVIDDEDVTIKITGIDPDNAEGYVLKVFLENKSDEKLYSYSVIDAYVNGVESKPLFSTEVAAGKKANDKIIFFEDELEEHGITEFTDIELNFLVIDNNTWDTDYAKEVTINVYPYGEENAKKFVREPQASDTVVIDNEYITVIVTDYEKDEFFGYVANLFIVNKMDDDIMISVEEASVNGFMADPLFATSISAGKCTFNFMNWDDATLEENDITEVETIEFLLRVYDYNNWDGTDLLDERITLNP